MDKNMGWIQVFFFCKTTKQDQEIDNIDYSDEEQVLLLV